MSIMRLECTLYSDKEETFYEKLPNNKYAAESNNWQAIG